jgi:hypothetical protein
MLSLLGTMLELLSFVLDLVPDSMFGLLCSMLDSASGMFKVLGGTIKWVLLLGAGEMGELASEMLCFLCGLVASPFRTVLELLAIVLDLVSDMLSTLLDSVLSLLGTMLELLAVVLDLISDSMFGLLGSLKWVFLLGTGEMGELSSEVLCFFGGLVASLLSTMLDLLAIMLQLVSDVLGALLDSVLRLLGLMYWLGEIDLLADLLRAGKMDLGDLWCLWDLW